MREILREDFLQHLMKANQLEMKKVFTDYYQKTSYDFNCQSEFPRI